MKLLIYEWNSYFQTDIYAICKEKKIDFDIFQYVFQDKNIDDGFESWFERRIQTGYYDALVSVNYWPLLAKVCYHRNIKYIAWCYDAPLNVLNIEETLGYSCNFVFLFDKMQFFSYLNAGFETVYHLPLGVNGTRLRNMKISQEDVHRYSSQVSFVGSLYESVLQDIMYPMSDHVKGYLNALMDIQSKIYGYNFLDEFITQEMIENVNARYVSLNPVTNLKLSREALIFALASEITRRDRLILLDLCGRRFETRLYSYHKSELLGNVQQYPAVDYIKESPKIFACSRVNLNPTLRAIQTGIPLRAFDIMGAGGLLVSNYQEELLELYENEKELIVYDSMEDAIAKIIFYLEHEDLRARIAAQGKEKTLERHTLQNRMELILKTAGVI